MKPLAPVAAAIAVLATSPVDPRARALAEGSSGHAVHPRARALADGSSGRALDRADPPVVIPDEARQCPEVMRGISLVFRPISGGVALEFTSPREPQVAELREQLR